MALYGLKGSLPDIQTFPLQKKKKSQKKKKKPSITENHEKQSQILQF